jgi:ribulose-5-phosphate 4-epimerase/fuculose-1-phosphate aldolase
MHNDTELGSLMTCYAQRAYLRLLVGGTGGNFSARLPGERMLITATGVSLGDTQSDNLVTVKLSDDTWEARSGQRPSKEYLYHADIYRVRKDVDAVLHVHPPYATAYAVKRRSIPMVTDAGFKQPPIPSVPFAPSGTEQLRAHVRNAIERHADCRALLLEQHGLVALGRSVINAYDVADLIEELARIAYLSESLK